jgi:hypothetical protein
MASARFASGHHANSTVARTRAAAPRPVIARRESTPFCGYNLKTRVAASSNGRVSGQMAVVGSLSDQHVDLRRLAQDIASFLDPVRLARNCTAVRLNLSAFARKIRVHLALEERFLCERLLRHSDPTIVAKVAQHQAEMRSLGDGVAVFVERWPSEAAIQLAPHAFATQAKTVIDLAVQRFQLEDDDLYPCVEQLLGPSGTWPLDWAAGADPIRSAG